MTISASDTAVRQTEPRAWQRPRNAGWRPGGAPVRLGAQVPPGGLLWRRVCCPPRITAAQLQTGFLFPLYYLFRATFYTVATKSWEGTVHLWWVWAVWLTSVQSIKFSFVFTVNCVWLPEHKHVDLQISTGHMCHQAAHRPRKDPSSPAVQPEHPNRAPPTTPARRAAPGDGPTYPGGGAAAARAPGPWARPSQTEKSISIHLKTISILFKRHDYLNTFQVWQRNVLSNPISIS